MIIEAVFTTCSAFIVAGSPCAPCQVPVAARGVPVVRCLDVSHGFIEAVKPHVPCESSWSWDAVGDQGRAHGLLQVRTDVHGPGMRRMGLDPSNEAHRWVYAETVLWRNQGLAPWASSAECAKQEKK